MLPDIRYGTSAPCHWFLVSRERGERATSCRMPSCIVKGCSYSWKKKDPDIIIHAFPKDLESIRKWLIQTQQDFGDLEEFSRKILEGTKGAYRVCSRHFTADSYETRGFMTVLKKGAIPTIFPDSPENAMRYKKTKVPAKRMKIDSTSSNDGSVLGVGYKLSAVAWHPESLAALSSHNFISPVASKETCVQGLYKYTAGENSENDHDRSHSSYSERGGTGGQNITEERRNTLYHPRVEQTVGTVMGISPRLIHQGTNTEPFVGTSNKKVQANRQKKQNSVGIQCNLEDLPIENESDHYPFRISLRNFDVLIWADPFRIKSSVNPKPMASYYRYCPQKGPIEMLTER
ncbi:uncharacterized protein LOC121003903 [Bufo bufo]|uniref:uncharacterized protein LOC121003903 n=1 Tax=Bufo bufo TaxID=8384 RepID=UPI001ABEA025|nr:uncharacterized protein LOC121003903 [Bufo bufo]